MMNNYHSELKEYPCDLCKAPVYVKGFHDDGKSFRVTYGGIHYLQSMKINDMLFQRICLACVKELNTVICKKIDELSGKNRIHDDNLIQKKAFFKKRRAEYINNRNYLRSICR